MPTPLHLLTTLPLSLDSLDFLFYGLRHNSPHGCLVRCDKAGYAFRRGHVFHSLLTWLGLAVLACLELLVLMNDDTQPDLRTFIACPWLGNNTRLIDSYDLFLLASLCSHVSSILLDGQDMKRARFVLLWSCPQDI